MNTRLDKISLEILKLLSDNEVHKVGEELSNRDLFSDNEKNIKNNAGERKVIKTINAKAWDLCNRRQVINRTSSGYYKINSKGLELLQENYDVDKPIEDQKEKKDGNTNYFWLNANPKIWKISDYKIDEIQTYTYYNEKGNKRNVASCFEKAKKGDLVIGYETSPVKKVKSLMKITRGLHKDSNGDEVIELQIVGKPHYELTWDEIKTDKKLKNCRVVQNNQGSLFEITESDYKIIMSYLNQNTLHGTNLSSNDLGKENFNTYSFKNDTDKPFVSEETFNTAVRLLKRKKKIILQGAPGVGKTFIAKKLAYQIMQQIDDDRIEMIQFHQSYSYEDFVQGIKPTSDGYAIQNGIFYDFCNRAKQNQDKEYFFIIDEINRGNLSKIFGELMMLIEEDKRNENYAIQLTYGNKNEVFFIPDNVYIIGCMNTSDRSLAIVDYALRRRFSFVTLKPVFNETFKSFITDKGISLEFANKICRTVSAINKEISKEITLGEGMCIGHSYFCNFKEFENEKIWFNDILEYDVKPYLDEICFDNEDNNKRWYNMLANLTAENE